MFNNQLKKKHCLKEIQELRDIHTSHMKATCSQTTLLTCRKQDGKCPGVFQSTKVFRDLRLVQRRPTLDAFTAVVQHALHAQQPVRHKVQAAALQRSQFDTFAHHIVCCESVRSSTMLGEEGFAGSP